MKGRLPITQRQFETQQALERFLPDEPTVVVSFDSLHDLVPDVADTLRIGYIEAELRLGELHMALSTLALVEDPCSWN